MERGGTGKGKEGEGLDSTPLIHIFGLPLQTFYRRYVALVVVLWCLALSSSASVAALR